MEKSCPNTGVAGTGVIVVAAIAGAASRAENKIVKNIFFIF